MDDKTGSGFLNKPQSDKFTVLTKLRAYSRIYYVALFDTERWSSWFKAPVLKTGVVVRLP